MESGVRDRPVLLVGGGLCGLTAAIFLRMANIPFRVFESSERPTDIGGTVTIFPNGMKVLSECGVKDAVVRGGASTRRAVVQDEFGKQFSTLTMGAEERYSEPTITLRRALLHQILIERAQSLGVKIEYGKKLVDVSQDQDRVSAEFADRTRAEGAILIGADGVHSIVRDYVIPGNAGPTYTGLVFFAGFVSDQRLISRAAMDRNAQYVTVGPIGFFGYSHVAPEAEPDATVLWNCYLRQDDRIPSADLRTLTDVAIRRRVADAHQGWHWPILDLIENSTTFCRTSVFEVIGLERWSRGRVMLIGDAAHAMNPVAGQGANMALEDAQLLVELLKHPRLPVEKVFLHFEAVRKPRVTRAARRAHRSSRLTMVKVSGLRRWIRNVAYAAMTRVVPDSWTNRRFRYEVGRDTAEILKRLSNEGFGP
jgi:2-polyprenyl-6-methoxyphenol hydroxylase-like FAD-dependent oxidoreductase